MSHGWRPDWELGSAPAGDDEADVVAFRERSLEDVLHPGMLVAPWERLEEWQRESWRREYRESKSNG